MSDGSLVVILTITTPSIRLFGGVEFYGLCYLGVSWCLPNV